MNEAVRSTNKAPDSAAASFVRSRQDASSLGENAAQASAQRMRADAANGSQRAKALQKSAEMMNRSEHVQQLQALAQSASGQTGAMPPASRRMPDDGLPAQLKSGIESLSGKSMNHVKVHYNSPLPAQFRAHAYAQGADIHLASGQEKHLPHEAWHVVQQMQGRVNPTLQMRGERINDDPGLEREADIMGAQAQSWQAGGNATPPTASGTAGKPVLQARKVGLFGLEAEVVREPFIIAAKKDTDGANLISDKNISLEEYKLGEIGGNVAVTLDNEVQGETDTQTYRKYTVEYVQNAIDVVTNDTNSLKKMEADWGKALDFWEANIDNRELLYGVVKPEWYQANETWSGGQFDGKTDQPGVTKEKDQDAKFNWTNPAFLSYIAAKTKDPQVSIQLTAGSNLQGFIEVAALTQQVLLGRGRPDDKTLKNETWKKSREDDQEKPGNKKYMGLLFILKQYVDSKDTTNKRYAKEYVTLMSRTSLDALYGQLDGSSKTQFKNQVAKYVRGDEGNVILKYLKRGPEDNVFRQPSSKEDQANDITIEQMLLSITKQKKVEDEALVDDEDAGTGDIFSQSGLAGISEINPESEEMLKKYGLDAANEMKKGEMGIIFESRAAAPMALSKMPEIFQSIAVTLQKIELLDREAAKVFKKKSEPKKSFFDWLF